MKGKRHRESLQLPVTHSLFTASFTVCHNANPCSLTSPFAAPSAPLSVFTPSSPVGFVASAIESSSFSSDWDSLRRFVRGSRSTLAPADREAMSLFDIVTSLYMQCAG